MKRVIQARIEKKNKATAKDKENGCVFLDKNQERKVAYLSSLQI